MKFLSEENKALTILDNAPFAILLFDKNGEIEYINKAFKDLGILYDLQFTSEIQNLNILNKEVFKNFSIQKEILDIIDGFPFEKEINFVETNTNGLIHLIVKGAAIYENEIVVGGMLLFEDLKILTRAKKEFALRNDFIENALKCITDFFIVVDKLDRIQIFSNNILDFVNTTAGSLQGASIGSIFNSEMSQKIKNALTKAKETRSLVTEHFNYEYKKVVKSFECKFIPQENYKKELSFIYLFFTDVSKKESYLVPDKKVTETLNYYQTIASKTEEAVFVVNSNNKIEYWDNNSEKLFEIDLQNALGQEAKNVISILSDSFLDTIRLKLKEKELYKLTLTFFDKNKTKRIYDTFFTFLDELQKKIAVKSIDVTDKIHFEEGLKLSLKNIKGLLAKSREMICSINAKGNILFTNESLQSFFGYEEEEFLAKSFYDLILPEYLENNIFDLNSFVGDDAKIIDLPFLTFNKEIKELEVTFLVSKDSENKILGYNCYFSELSDTAETGHSNDIYNSLIENAYDGIALVSEGKIILANSSFAKIFGYENNNELLNKEIIEFASNDDILKVAEYFRLIERKKQNAFRFDFLAKKRDRSNFHAEFSIGTFSSNIKNYVVIIARDVTERIRTQKAIRESEEKYRSITENIDDFLFTFERTGFYIRPVFCTTSIQKITGYTQTDFLSDSKLFIKIIHPDDYAILKPKITNLFKSRIQLSAEYEFRIINKQGNIVWVRTKLNLARNASSKINKIFGLVSDITIRKRAEEELKKSTQNLIKLNETKDRFISIISHDLRTPFSSILGFTDLLANDEELTEEERKQYVRYIQESSRSMLALVNSLLDWTRIQTGRIRFEPQRTDVAKIALDSINALKGTAIQKGIEITSDLERSLFLFVDKNLIAQVFNNLLSNAIKFTNKSGTIKVSAEHQTGSRFIQFSIADNGVGIKPDDLSKLFDVDSKFTSEGTAGEKGSGLGLSLVKEIVEKHGGNIWAESVYGKGSEFKFSLPIASSNILLVDDNKTDRLLYSKILKNISPEYTVDVASDGKEALEKIKLSPPALIITDHAMPVMNGYEFVIELKKTDIKGKPPVIVLSSDIDRAAVNDYTELGIEFVFQKPVNLTSFKLAVEKSLLKGLSGD